MKGPAAPWPAPSASAQAAESGERAASIRVRPARRERRAGLAASYHFHHGAASSAYGAIHAVRDSQGGQLP